MMIMQWKIGRGKDRPMLLGMIRENTPKSITDASTKSFKLLMQDDWKGAMESLIELRGVGPATASAILAPLDPINCPFMSDEVLESCTKKKREYTMNAYVKMRNVLVMKAEQLGQGWTAEKLGKALWAHAIHSCNNNTKEPVIETLPSSRNVKRKIDVAEPSIISKSGRKKRKHA